jgi:hypothetical protein
MGSFERTVNSGKIRCHVLQDMMNTELAGALVFVFQLKSGGLKLLHAPLCCITAKANSDSTNLPLFF